MASFARPAGVLSGVEGGVRAYVGSGGVFPDACGLTGSSEHEIIVEPGVRNHEWPFSRSARWPMTDFNRKVEDTSARIHQKVTETAATVEKELAEIVDYLDREVVPSVRQHSTKALRVAADKLAKLADYLEQNPTPKK